MSKEIPILFSTPMVQAILAGRKTMTRRLAGDYVDEYAIAEMITDAVVADPDAVDIVEKQLKGVCVNFDDGEWIIKSRWQPGDLLWVREAWKPSIHMPKNAARIWLEVTDVKVERLHDISEEDAKAEGVGAGFQMNAGWPDYLHIQNGVCSVTQDTASVSFGTLWEFINGKESWEANPWVWVVSFKVLSTTGKP
jgi:hypothetical protein